MTLPKKALIVLIGAAGAGKSTLARTWPDSQILSLDTLRGTVSDDPGNQEATEDALAVMHLLLNIRMRRRLTTVIDATNVEPEHRKPLIDTAKRHHMPTIAVVVPTPEATCIDRQHTRPPNRAVPTDVIRQQHQALRGSHHHLAREGFNHVLLASEIQRLEPLLQRLAEVHTAELAARTEHILPRRFFGPELLPLWTWCPDSSAADGDPVAEIRLGRESLTLALRIDEDGGARFDVRVPCPIGPDCRSAWAPAFNTSDLHRALIGAVDPGDICCTVHGSQDDHLAAGRAAAADNLIPEACI